VSVVRRRGETGQPPSGSNWIHEIKHEDYRLMARRDPVGIRLLTKWGSDWSARFPEPLRIFRTILVEHYATILGSSSVA
jgi:ATP-dependent DNA ligase